MSTHRLATASCALGMLTYAGLMSIMSGPPASAVDRAEDGTPPAEIELTGKVRDFREQSVLNGHPDFESHPDSGFGLYVGNVAGTLGDDDVPVFTGAGHRVDSQWRDAENRPISWCVALNYPKPGDVAGTLGPEDTGGVHSGDSFEQWYRDTPGVNMSQLLTLTLKRAPDGTYVFDDTLDSQYAGLGGFFPIEDQLFGNPGGYPDRNFHFTFELHGTFVYDAHAGQLFKFVGDDDVWVYINGELVIDIGGVHSAQQQYVDLDRLGLHDDETYRLDFFFAERHRTESNFRIVTNLVLESIPPTTISSIFD